MTRLLIYCLCVYGLSSIVVTSSLFSVIRLRLLSRLPWLGNHISCMMCFGTTSGFIIHIVSQDISPFPMTISGGFLAMMAGSGISWMLYVIESAAIAFHRRAMLGLSLTDQDQILGMSPEDQKNAI